MVMTNSITSALKTAGLNFINPFTSNEKTISVIAAIGAKFILNFSFKYSCLIGFLTFGGLKIYQFGKKQQSELDTSFLNNMTASNFVIIAPAPGFGAPVPLNTTPDKDISKKPPQKTDKATGPNNVDDNRI